MRYHSHSRANGRAVGPESHRRPSGAAAESALCTQPQWLLATDLHKESPITYELVAFVVAGLWLVVAFSVACGFFCGWLVANLWLSRGQSVAFPPFSYRIISFSAFLPIFGTNL